jgi:hypothetical protein
MTRTITFLLALAVASGQVQINPPMNTIITYAGPGDVTSGAKTWWGLRAYSAAKGLAGVAAIKLCTAADAACTDIHVTANGGLSAADIATAGCSLIDTCTIKTVYDQSGALACGPSGQACDYVQATIGLRPTFLRSCIGSLPCISSSAGNLFLTGTAFLSAMVQPYTMSEVVSRTASFTTQQGTIFLNGNGGDIEFASTTNTALIYAGGVGNATAANTTKHAFNVLFSGASSNFYIDGSANTVNAGTSNAGGGGGFWLLSAGATSLTGLWFEAGAWTGNQSANFSAMNSNQHTYWGF